MALLTEGLKTAPIDGTLLADSGGLSTGGIRIFVAISAEYRGKVVLVHRNALNDADIATHVMFVPDGPKIFPVPAFTCLQNERLLVRVSGDMAGEIQASILW